MANKRHVTISYIHSRLLRGTAKKKDKEGKGENVAAAVMLNMLNIISLLHKKVICGFDWVNKKNFEEEGGMGQTTENHI